MNINLGISFRKSRLTGLLIGATALAASIGCVDLQDADPAAINGILQNVDSVSGEVTVQLKDGTTTTFNLEDVDVEALQAIAGSAVLQAGDEVELTLDDDESVTTVVSTSAKAEGIVATIDTETSSVTVDTENGVQLTVSTDSGTEIKAKGPGPSEADFSELTLGQEVKVHYNAETNVASKIQFRRPGQDDDDEDDENETEDDVKGIVTSVDSEAFTIVLVDENDVEYTFTIVASTEIDDDGPVTFAAIQVGSEVEVKFDPQSMQAMEVEIEETEEADEADESNDEDDEDDEDEDDDEEEDDDEDASNG
ncbi:MAG: hypothetical protein H8D69_02755 [Chloroflexi bacterium]|nr:hypothetical protein [Chloroflexota bacterium]